MTVQVADAMVRVVNRVGRGPATGAPLAFTICTGDNFGNTQYNEARWAIDVLDGQPVRPGSGDPALYQRARPPHRLLGPRVAGVVMAVPGSKAPAPQSRRGRRTRNPRIPVADPGKVPSAETGDRRSAAMQDRRGPCRYLSA